MDLLDAMEVTRNAKEEKKNFCMEILTLERWTRWVSMYWKNCSVQTI